MKITVKHLMLLLCGCLIMCACSGKTGTALPENPIEFIQGTYTDPDSPQDEYLSIEYNGRIYISYGTLKGSVGSKDVGDCLGYIVQNNEKIESVRVCLLNADPNANYLIVMDVEGEMSQPDFFRAIDTAGKEVDTPAFIDNIGYDYWTNRRN